MLVKEAGKAGMQFEMRWKAPTKRKFEIARESEASAKREWEIE
jgi:hypothetical protein